MAFYQKSLLQKLIKRLEHMSIVFVFGIGPGHWERLRRKAEKGNKVQASPLCAFSFPKCLKTMLRNALHKLNQLPAAFMFRAFLSHTDNRLTSPRSLHGFLKSGGGVRGISFIQHPYPKRAALFYLWNALYPKKWWLLLGVCCWRWAFCLQTRYSGPGNQQVRIMMQECKRFTLVQKLGLVSQSFLTDIHVPD